MFAIFDLPHPDPNPLPLTNSPWPIALIVISYLMFVLKLGRMYMENRKPYDLKRILKAYNLFQVAYNGIFFAVTFYYLIIIQICDLKCMETFPLGHERKQLERMVHLAYYINKIVDLLDTVFFVLRKSYKQISFLHVFHHVSVVTTCYSLMRFYGTGGHVNAVGMINSFVHTVMYFYYYLSSEYPAVKGSLWWKKYITITQLVQFAMILLHSSYVLIFSAGCQFPKSILYMMMAQAILMTYMFGQFYMKTYLRPRASAKVS